MSECEKFSGDNVGKKALNVKINVFCNGLVLIVSFFEAIPYRRVPLNCMKCIK